MHAVSSSSVHGLGNTSRHSHICTHMLQASSQWNSGLLLLPPEDDCLQSNSSTQRVATASPAGGRRAASWPSSQRVKSVSSQSTASWSQSGSVLGMRHVCRSSSRGDDMFAQARALSRPFPACLLTGLPLLCACRSAAAGAGAGAAAAAGAAVGRCKALLLRLLRAVLRRRRDPSSPRNFHGRVNQSA